MPDMVEQLYCSQQITVPAMFPFILKQYAKAAIRTQPYDLLRWSASYFTAMANGETPPVKFRIEYPPHYTESGLTPGYLRVLLSQLGVSGVVPMHVLYKKWQGVCLNESCLREMLAIGGFGDMVDWLHFLAIATAHLTDSLAMTMCLCCELLTEEPEGGSAMVPCEVFLNIYNFLARLDCGPPKDPSLSRIESEVRELVPIIPICDDPSQEALGESDGASGGAGQELPGEDDDFAPSAPDDPAPEDSAPEDTAPEASSEEHDGPQGHQNEEEGEAGGDDEFDAELRLQVDNSAEENFGSDTAAAPPADVPATEDEEPAADADDGSVDDAAADADAAADVDVEAETQTTPLARHVPGIGAAVPAQQIAQVELYMRAWADRQQGMVMPRNIRHFLCPPLDPMSVARQFQVDSSEDVHDQSYLYPQRRPLTCQDVNKDIN